MEIHGCDTVITSNIPIAENLIRLLVQDHWPKMVHELDERDGVIDLFMYENEAAKKAWDDEGWSETNDADMIYAILAKECKEITIVIDDNRKNQFILEEIPNKLDACVPSITTPDFPISITLPEIKMLPPITFNSPLYISGIPIPFPPISVSNLLPPFISITWPSITLPPISFGLPPQIVHIQSPTSEPTTAEKCKLILEKIVELANEGKPIGFEQDFGGWTATIAKGKMHTHVGIPGKDGNFDILVNNLYDLLIKGKGLSWA
jgi:hypothetical protein